MSLKHLGLCLFLGVALSGCLLMPLPWPSEEPRFTDEQIYGLVPGATTRDVVRERLGPPKSPEDFVRLDGKYWVYTWRQRGAGRLVAVGVGGAVVPFKDRQVGLFLQFDEKGILTHRERMEWKPKSTWDDMNGGMCDTTGTCIQHPVGREPQTGLDIFLHDTGSAFTVPGYMVPAHPKAAQCSVVLWLDEEQWSIPAQHIESLYEQAPGGINVDYGPEGALGSKACTSWLPVGAFVVLTLPHGKREIRMRNPWPWLEPKAQSVPFDCKSGAISYASLGARSKKFGNEFGVVWHDVSPELATVRLQRMRELLLRECSTASGI